MPAFDISMFAGAMPAISDRLIANENATAASNVLLQNGDLAPLEGTALAPVQPALPAGTKTLYKYNDKWFAFAAEVEVIPSPVIADPYDRVYITGLDKPRVTRNDIATGAGVLPSATFPLGVPAPANAPTITYVPAEEADPDYADDVTRYYVLTYVTSTGEESAPGPLSEKVVVLQPDDNVTLSWPALVSNPYDITHVRVYRSESGTSESGFYQVGQVPIATIALIDNVSADALGATLQTTDYATPPENMRGITTIAGGIVLGYEGRTLYVSEAFEPYTYPNNYRQTTKAPIVAICPLSSGAVIATEGHPYIASGTMPGALSLYALDEPYPCVSARSMVNMQGYAIYASQDGLVGAGSGGAQLLTEQVFTPEQWRALKPETMHCYYHDGLYIAFYGDVNGTGNGTGALLFNPGRKDVTFADVYATAGYRDLAADSLYLVIDNQLHEWRKGAPLAYVWRSKVLDTPVMSFQCYRVRGEDITGLTLNVYADGQLLHSHTYTAHDEEPSFLPAQSQYRRWQVELIGQCRVYAAGIATSAQELS